MTQRRTNVQGLMAGVSVWMALVGAGGTTMSLPLMCAMCRGKNTLQEQIHFFLAGFKISKTIYLSYNM